MLSDVGGSGQKPAKMAFCMINDSFVYAIKQGGELFYVCHGNGKGIKYELRCMEERRKTER